MTITVEIDESFLATAEPLIEQLKQLERRAVQPAGQSINRQKVRDFIRRCKLDGHEVQVKAIIAVADIDESQFHKWQRGEQVSLNVRLRCEEVICLATDEYLRRYQSAQGPRATSSVPNSSSFQ